MVNGAGGLHGACSALLIDKRVILPYAQLYSSPSFAFQLFLGIYHRTYLCNFRDSRAFPDPNLEYRVSFPSSRVGTVNLVVLSLHIDTALILAVTGSELSILLLPSGVV